MREKRAVQKRKIPLYITVLTVVAYVASLLVVGFDYILPQTHDLSVDMVAPIDFNAPRQAENVFLTNIEREIAANSVQTVFQMEQNITNEILQNLEQFFVQIGRLRAHHLPIISPIPHGEPLAENGEIEDVHITNVELTQEQLALLTTDSSVAFARFRATLTQGIENILNTQITTQASITGELVALRDNNLAENLGFAYAAIGHAIAEAFVRVNWVPNETETERLRQEARDSVTPILIQMNQIIVRAGDIIDEEAYTSLVELGFIGVSFAFVFSGIVGSVLAVSIIFAIAILYIHLFMKNMAFNKKQALLLFTLYMMVLVLIRVMTPLPFYFTPIMLFAMLCAILIDMRLSAVLATCVSIMAVVMEPMNTMFITYAIINGIMAAMIARRMIVRANMWSAAAAFVLVNALTVFANYLIFGTGASNQMFMSSVLAMVGGVMTITITYGSLPLWESVFKVVTQNTLLELTDPNNALLRRLLIETPGTYHHSLVVANLAEAACYDIGANHVLARVGAYYHDIGKMKYPQYFAENQTEANPHDMLPPLTSVEVINEHVLGGLALARQYKIPQQVMDFIDQHHGTSLMKVFLYKEKAANPDREDSVDENLFRYPHIIPQNPETAVVMLADTCEAAVRAVYSKGDKDLDGMESFVRKLIKDKLDDGQLNDSKLSIKDLDTIALSFMRVFKGMHHERIPYPTPPTPDPADLIDSNLEEAAKRG